VKNAKKANPKIVIIRPTNLKYGQSGNPAGNTQPHVQYLLRGCKVSTYPTNYP